MENMERRKYILCSLKVSKTPITGSALSKECQVSRQIIVGDIALLRAQGEQIVSTPRGYQLVRTEKTGIKKVIVCCHSTDMVRQELEAIVDNGGIIHNVCVEHEVYGYLEANLKLRSRRDIAQYIEDMERSRSELLCSISGGIHTHLIETATEADMEAIEEELRRLGILYGDK